MRTSTFHGSYRVLSYGFRIEASVPGLGERLDDLLARFRAPRLDGAARYELRREPSTGLLVVDRDGVCVQRGRTEASIVDFVLWDAGTRAVERATDLLALHAGAVALDGRGVLLPAPPDSGKTTLTAALTRAGFSYLSDEVAPIDPGTGLLRPFPRALWMDARAIDRLGGLWERLPEELRALRRAQYHVRPEDLRPDPVGGDVRVHLVVAPAYAGGREVRLEPLSRAEALVLLAENAFNLERFGGRGVEVLARVVAGARCFRLRMGDLEEAVRAVRGLLGG
ncbi:MAG TPA: hypothetical protein VNO79_04225 [Actinomycetota bacterium]|nr:hypothetical protein [Actinomycetota bacterium]